MLFSSAIKTVSPDARLAASAIPTGLGYPDAATQRPFLA
jgi:hypothetical protein